MGDLMFIIVGRRAGSGLMLAGEPRLGGCGVLVYERRN